LVAGSRTSSLVAMARLAAIALAAAALATRVAADDDGCTVGVTLKGLGKFDGNFMGGGLLNDGEYRHNKDGVTYDLAFSSTDDRGAKHNCASECSPADQKKAINKWTIFRSGVNDKSCGIFSTNGSYCTLFAVCVSGCPDSTPAENSPRWPHDGVFETEWEVYQEDGSGRRLSISGQASASCCKGQRGCTKTFPEGTCTEDTCNSDFWGSCPKNDLAAKCCEEVGSGGWWPPKECVCMDFAPVCRASTLSV